MRNSRLLLLLLAVFALLTALLTVQPARSQAPAALLTATLSPTPASQDGLTEIQVRVISRGGKFVSNDIGGALVSIRDARTGELLASGKTRGGSGVADLMTVPRARTTPLPTEDAAAFIAQLPLDEPRLVEIEAYGPLAAQGSANRVTATQWLVPQQFLGAPNVALLELPGLNVDIVNPPTHFMPSKPPLEITLRVNVTMMCGCPIGPKTVWKPENYKVQAMLYNPDGTRDVIDLTFDTSQPEDAPSQFIGTHSVMQSGVYEAIVFAYQQPDGNTGSDRITFILP